MHVDECGRKIIIQLTWPTAISSAKFLMKITQMQDPDITAVHPFMGGITESLKLLKENINDDVLVEYEAPIPVQVQQNVLFIRAVELRDGAKIIHIRLQGIVENFSNTTRDEGSIKKLDF